MMITTLRFATRFWRNHYKFSAKKKLEKLCNLSYGKIKNKLCTFDNPKHKTLKRITINFKSRKKVRIVHLAL